MSDVYTSAGEAFVASLIDTAMTTPHLAAGTGTAAATKADTALQAQVGTRMSCIKSRPHPDVIQFTAVATYASAYPITEVGVFTAAIGGTMLQRHVFAPLNVNTNVTVEWTVRHEQN